MAPVSLHNVRFHFVAGNSMWAAISDLSCSWFWEETPSCRVGIHSDLSPWVGLALKPELVGWFPRRNWGVGGGGSCCPGQEATLGNPMVRGQWTNSRLPSPPGPWLQVMRHMAPQP